MATESASPNSLYLQAGANQVCKAFGIKISSNGQVVITARNAGFDSLFIDMEHAWLSLEQVSNLCQVGLLAGITPFVRVPHQCGNGFVQRALDGGAMGIIFPHIHSEDDAKNAVRICKYPPKGCRSMTGMLPQVGLRGMPLDTMIPVANQSLSTVFVMIESADAVEKASEIAAVDGVDVVLIGSTDLSIDLGVGGQFEQPTYRNALIKVSEACRAHGKIMGLAGVYDSSEIQSWAINDLGVRFILVQQDTSLLSQGAIRAAKAVPAVI
ncbi:Phosphoenolpyruvate/pyruvate domain-containing protein [Aspergillus steynii IBT 23096]|uniref:Phosphoenolpyruvate/pyruvate domain-containing protein n=1 Tax=Aspergillus steynii IBT 23096 TaxID=1392250 RepID=A0A2I2FXQ3_9EURO|nr:Phosphoenolpyruvate/pyruvate domain-containing protein [Aspergillus steynii IBT 23096]PLB45414.1 Phosphoenolpyruvate/pyruvate domain-containing protein [Aspergillus steynii IBT 23096]